MPRASHRIANLAKVLERAETRARAVTGRRAPRKGEERGVTPTLITAAPTRRPVGQIPARAIRFPVPLRAVRPEVRTAAGMLVLGRQCRRRVAG